MENKFNKVLTACRIQAKKDGGNVNVFDLMYEASLAYPELKDILDELVLNNELEVIDIKTYKYIRKQKEELESNEDIVFNKLPCDNVLYYETEEDDGEDDDLDERFAEYEKYFRENIGGLFGTEESEARTETSKENGKLIEFLKELLCLGQANKPWEEIPEHPSWEDGNDFMRVCAEKLMEIVNSDKRMGRQGALKKATVLLEDVQKNTNRDMVEVYECIVFELRNMSNYYYIKIRDGLL